MIIEIPFYIIISMLTQRFGLGETGEMYLVGADGLMRSNLRFFDDALENIFKIYVGFVLYKFVLYNDINALSIYSMFIERKNKMVPEKGVGMTANTIIFIGILYLFLSLIATTCSLALLLLLNTKTIVGKGIKF